jgi:hypothetical protein
METCLLQPTEWAQLEFSASDLGDARRSKRLVRVASALVQCPSGTLTQAFPDWAELKAAYRLFSNAKVSYEKILAPHCERTRQSCTQPGEYLLIEDTSELDYSTHPHCQGLGQIGNEHGRGLLLHSTLVAQVNAWDLDHCPEVQVLGLAGQKCWARSDRSHRPAKETQRQRFERARESQRWAQVLSQMPPRPQEATWIYLADREADVYETFQRCEQKQIDWIVRAQSKRVMAEEDQSLFEAVAKAPVLGTFEMDLRARSEKSARVAQLEIRAVEVSLRGAYRPGGTQAALRLTAVQACEIEPPASEEPVHWVLLTSLPAERFVQGRRIVARYAKRWMIEEFHKALKSGAHVEKSELETAERLKALLAVLAVVAVRLLNTKLVARCDPQRPVDVESFGREAVQILTARFGEPAGGWKHGSLLIAIARLGGFLARRGDGHPGWTTIWRGWQRLMTMVDGVLSLEKKFAEIGTKRCG